MTAAASTGQVELYYQLPATSTGGFVGGAVLLNAKMNGSTTFRKCTAIE